jgi:catechol 2,3-dioxygenase-like lactoylglutathione lyase family enzyme
MAGIRHIEIWVSDLKTSLAFYIDFLSVIGWKQVDENGISCGNTKIYFRERKGITRQTGTLGPRHICFEAVSNEEVTQVSLLPVLKERILHGPAVLHPGNYMVVFTDLDGSILEVAHKS